MAFERSLIMGIAIACSLILSNCAFPVRPGYDRKSGSYKRYRVPKQEIVDADTTTVNSQEELVQEEILAAASKNTGKAQMSSPDSNDTSAQDSTNSANLKLDISASRDSSVIKTTAAQKQDSTQARNGDFTKVAANTTAKTAEKPTEKNTAKKTDKKDKKQTKVAKPTNLEKYAREWLGAKYVYGAASKKKTDCSGYVMQVYKGFYGIALDHNAQRIYDDGRGYSIKRKKLQEGDLVFFGNFWKIGHVGIYLKGDRFIHASTSNGVVITPMDDNYWASKYKGARRFK